MAKSFAKMDLSNSYISPDSMELNSDSGGFSLKRKHSISEMDFSKVRKTEELFKCMTSLMTAGGLYYRPLNRKCPYFPLDFIYCCVIFLLVTEEVIRSFYYYDRKEDFATKIFKALEQVYIVKFFFSIVIALSLMTPRLRRCFINADHYHANWISGIDMNEFSRLRRRIIFCLLFLSGIRIGIGILPLFELKVCANWARQLLQHDINHTVAGLLCMLYRLFFQFADTFCYILAYVTSANLAEEFIRTASALQGFLQEPSEEGEGGELKQHRKRYLDLCDLVDSLDHALGPLILNLCVFDLIIVVFHVIAFTDVNLYGMSSTWTQAIGVASMLDKAMHMGILIYAGSNISSKAKAVKPLLITIDAESYSQKSFQEAFMFLQKVTQDYIGLTAWGMFNINKSFIVTVVSLGLTYAIILMRFGMMMSPANELLSNATNSTEMYLNTTFHGST